MKNPILLTLLVGSVLFASTACENMNATKNEAPQEQMTLLLEEEDLSDLTFKESTGWSSLEGLDEDESTSSLFEDESGSITYHANATTHLDLSVSDANALDGTSDASTSKPSTFSKEAKEQKRVNPATKMKIIKNGRIDLEVENAAAVAYEIESKVSVAGGYVANSELKESNSYIRNEMQVRIPNEAFESFVNQVGKMGMRVTYKKIWTQDVSEEYYDVQTRLKNKKEVEARYIDILRTKAKTVEEVLATEEKLRVLREEIESKEGRLRFLSNQVSYSTLFLVLLEQLEEDEILIAEITFWDEISDSFANGWKAILTIILFFTNLWPFILLVLGGWLVFKKRIFNKA